MHTLKRVLKRQFYMKKNISTKPYSSHYHIHQNIMRWCRVLTLRWRHDERDGVSNHQPHHCLLNRLFGRRSKKTSKLRVTGLCAGNSPVTGEFLAQRSSNAENVSIWWRHHDTSLNLESKIQSFALSFMNIFCNLSGSFFRPNVLNVLHGRCIS